TPDGSNIPGGQAPSVANIYRYLITKYGFTPAQAAGILGNMQVESGFNTAAYNSGEGAIGLCQWEGGRRRQLEQFAAARGKPVTDWQVQVDFMAHELAGSESGAYRYIKAAQTPAAAAAAFDQYYERSDGAARGQRMANANQFAASLGRVSV
ncbi:phage tail tip lysozyme, partial [Nocardia sp. NPDC049220]|uniref:phage tail tip lysozyme n=1 Tax=Nocardia sp. NPDC049220 TaxID=3155273 RepID=UPI0034054EF7